MACVRLNRKEGYTLAEVLVASAIMISTFAMFMSLNQSLSIFSRGDAKQTALAIAQEEMRSALSAEDFIAVTSEKNVDIKGFRFTVTQRNEYIQISDNQEIVVENPTDLKRIQIIIAWTETRNGEPEQRDVQLQDFYN